MAAVRPLKPAIEWGMRIILASAFIAAGVAKLIDTPAFVANLGHFRLLPYPLTVALALYLPWLELWCGMAVVVRHKDQAALFMLVGLCAMFTVALASAWWRGLDIDCGCFGHVFPATKQSFAIARSAALGLIGVVLWGRSRQSGLSE